MKSYAVLFLAIGILLSSCSKEEWSVVDNYVTDTYKEMRDGAIGGHHRCYRANFPLTIVFSDETTSEVADRREFVSALKTWKEANPDAEERPTIQFPFSITRLDGEIIEVNSQEEIAVLRAECRIYQNRHRKCGAFGRYLDNKCFEVQLPISVVMADGEVIEIEEKRDMKDVLKSWLSNRPDEIPEVSFPISVTMKDSGEVVEIEDNEAFDALVEACKE
ncbi:hypothetical protein [Portibacter lacus]|uniref:Lipoprotein n=1 Tax=Portibacter lacus TaxID=1099794 RepID=A0AA37WIK0_9BACT|nr:hypothetical protein [Portibacter lacus]GLR19785.1 hypothetical protein GCM10007940_44010 [Portibacter lacus]